MQRELADHNFNVFNIFGLTDHRPAEMYYTEHWNIDRRPAY